MKEMFSKDSQLNGEEMDLSVLSESDSDEKDDKVGELDLFNDKKQEERKKFEGKFQ